MLSNSCDISPDNDLPLAPNVTFVPLVRLDRYDDLLKAAGQTEQQRDSVMQAMRRQEITSLMHLPPIQGVMPESVALFTDVRSHPVENFRVMERSRLFRLSDFGFYLFLLKLSIHFTRMLEGVER